AQLASRNEYPREVQALAPTRTVDRVRPYPGDPMGIFDFFLSEEARIQKNQRTLTNRDVQAEDRDKAARWLADQGSPKAIVALLTRFDMNLENQLKDKAEKDFVYGLVAGMGEQALRALERHIEKCRQIALPMRMFVELKGEEAGILKAYEILEV